MRNHHLQARAGHNLELIKPAAASPPPAVTLQNQWYNTLAQNVAGSANFQLLQPNAPIPPQATNDLLWQYFNDLPPVSLNDNLVLSGGNQFYSNYSAVLSQLTSNALTNFQSVLGSYYPLWQQYLGTVTPFPTLAQLPNVFYQWALVNAPTIAGPGRSAYQAALLDPIFNAQMLVLNTSGFVNNMPNFSQGVTQLFQQIPGGPSVSLTFDSATASSDISSTWAQGNSGAFFGIFGEGDTSSSQLTQTFASSRVTATINFKHVITFNANPPGAPNGWYSSAALGAAEEASSGGAPWNPSANPSWTTTFGPNGNMRYFTAALIVADGIQTTITSYASYSSDQQTTITQSSSSGFWPFYWSSGSSTFQQNVSFNSSNQMTYTQSSPVGNPVVIGALVLPASQYLGGNQQFASFVVPPSTRRPPR